MENRATAPRGRNDHSEQIPECDEERRKRVNGMLDPGTRTGLGQFMTPAAVAGVLAECIDVDRDELHLLDPGSGVGSLTAAVVARILSSEHRPKTVSLTTYEIDPTMREGLARRLTSVRLRWLELACPPRHESSRRTSLSQHCPIAGQAYSQRPSSIHRL